MMTITNVPNQQRFIREHLPKLALIFALVFCAVWPIYLSGLPAAISAPQVEMAKMPLAFVPNLGQTNPDVRFQAHDLDGTLFLTADELVMALQDQATGLPAVIRLAYQNSSSAKEITGLDQLNGTISYMNGRSPENWRMGLPAYSSIQYKGLYPGIDLFYKGNGGAVESVYQVAPGVNPDLIRWSHSGIQQAKIDPITGDLLLFLPGQTKPVLTEKAPQAWQEINGLQIDVPIQFAIHEDQSLGFKFGSYNPAYALTIDPTLVYSTYLGGGKLEDAEGIALDGDHNIYITGTTISTDFPTQSPYQSSKKGSDDVYVIKLNPAGDTLIYATYLGGSQDDEGNAITVDTTGNAYVVGQTYSKDFPVQHGYASQCKMDGDLFCVGDAFLARLNPAGSALLYSTYLGGIEPDYALGVAAGAAGQAVMTGVTHSGNFPTKDAYQAALKGGSDAFVTAIDTTKAGAESLTYSTYLGGTADEAGSGIILTSDAKAVVTGHTNSSNFPTQAPLQAALKGQTDAFITAFNLAGSGLEYSTYLGGSAQEHAYGIALDSLDNAYIAGNTLSTDFPILDAVQSISGGKSDAFITAIKADGSAWLTSTYLGGSEDDYGYGIAVDLSGMVYVAGGTGSANFPIVNAFQAYGGNGDAFVAKLEVGTSEPVFSTFLGGKDADYGDSIALDNLGSSYIAGITFSTDFPVPEALYPGYAGGGDVFLAKIADSGENPPITPPVVTVTPPVPPALNPLLGSYKVASQITLAVGESLTYTIHLHNSGITDVTASVVDQLPEGILYTANSAALGGVYDAVDQTITWTDILVPSNKEVQLTYDATTDATLPALAVNKATITADGKSIERDFAVMVGHKTLPHQAVRPVVEKFTIDEQDALSSPDVKLHIELATTTQAEFMYLREWQIVQSPIPHWQVVKSSGWIPFNAAPDWKLGEQSGVHFMAVWVADKDHQVSLIDKKAIDFANLLPAETSVGLGGIVPYLVYYPKGTSVDLLLTPATGNPDLLVWYPNSLMLPDKISMKSGTEVEEVSFTAPRDGIYIILVLGREASTYNLAITPGGGMPPVSPGAGLAAAVDTASAITNEPLFSMIGLDPLASNTTNIPAVPDYWFYIPVVGH